MIQIEITVFFLTESKNQGFGAVTDAFRAFKSDETWLNKAGSKAPQMHRSMNQQYACHSLVNLIFIVNSRS